VTEGRTGKRGKKSETTCTTYRVVENRTVSTPISAVICKTFGDGGRKKKSFTKGGQGKELSPEKGKVQGRSSEKDKLVE